MPNDSSHFQSDAWTPDEQSLDRYLAGDCPEAERTKIVLWLERNPAATRRLWAIQQAALGDVVQVDESDVERIRARFHRSIEPVLLADGTRRVQTGDANSSTRPVYQRYARPMWFRGGAMLAVAVMVVITGVSWYTTPTRQLQMSPSALSYITARGQQAAVILPDGSQAYLNVASRIDVAWTDRTQNRTVDLQGEALFTVTPSPEKAFTVRAGPSTTRVLGTSFAVRYYKTDSVATISVREGKVSVDSTVVSASQEVVVGTAGVRSLQAASAGRFGFSLGTLTLDDVPLPDAILELSRWYDVQIICDDPALYNRRITAQFGGDSITDLVTNLEWAFKLRVERNGRTLTLHAKP